MTDTADPAACPAETGGTAVTTTGTPAAQLRAAAKLMRDRASLVPPPPWYVGLHDITTHSGHDVIASSGLTVRAQYVASWHPAIALAVADWLDDVATDADEMLKLDTPECPHDGGDCYCRPMAPEWGCDRCGEYLAPGACRCWDKAIAVARAYLGETP